MEQQEQTEINQRMSQIFIDIGGLLFGVFGENPDAVISATFEFDDLQRVVNIKDLTFNVPPTSPLAEIINTINELTVSIQSFPDIYRLKELGVTIEPGGKLETQPTYAV